MLPRPLWSFLVPCIVITALACPALAGDIYSHSVLGFSPNGRYFAYQESAILDGSGFPHCEITIFDVENNIKMTSEHKTLQEMETARISVCDQLYESFSGTLSAYGISAENDGDQIYKKTPKAIGTPDPDITTQTFEHRGKTWTLKLKKVAEPQDPQFYWGSYSYKLTLFSGKESLTLAEGSVMNISLSEAILFKDRIVVIAYLSSPGFEGPNSTPIVFSGRMPGTLPEGTRLDIGLLGFSEDASIFGYWLSGTNETEMRHIVMLHVFQVSSGKEIVSETGIGEVNERPADVFFRFTAAQKDRLAQLKLGNDPGQDLYTTGTLTKTTFTVDGAGTYELSLKKKTQGADKYNEDVDIMFGKQGKKPTLIHTKKGGFRHSLNTVRLSKDRKVIAVVIKYSRLANGSEDRLFDVVFVPVGK